MQVELIKETDANNFKVTKGFVVAGDIHLYNHYPYSDSATPGGISSRLNDIGQAMWSVGSTAKRLGLPLILNGDLLHTGVLDYPVLQLLARFLLTFKEVEMIINVGNHDLDGEHSVLNPLISFYCHPNHIAISEPLTYSPKNKNLIDYEFLFMPYLSKEKTVMALKNYEPGSNKKAILFIHNTFIGSRYSNSAISSSGLNQHHKYFNWFKIIVASHIHKYQEIKDNKGFYTSSIIPLNFGEKNHEHGFHIVDLSNEKCYFVIPSAPQFRYISLAKVKSFSPKELKHKVRNNIICVKTHKDVDINKKAIKELLMKGGARFITFKKIEDKPKSKQHIKIQKHTDIKSLVSSYSKLLANDLKLENSNTEKYGLRILSNAEIKTGKNKQKR